MRIAVFHELPAGGARLAVAEIAKRLGQNHTVDLYYVDDARHKEEEKLYNRKFFYRFVPKVWRGKNWKVRLFKDTVELYNLYKLHKVIANNIRKRRYDIVLINASQYIESPFILRFPNTKKVFYLHDPHDRSLYEKNLIKREKVDFLRRIYEKCNRIIKMIIDKQNLNGADLFLANSLFTQKVFTNTYGKQSEVAYLGVDSAYFSPKNLKKEIDVLYIGSREPVDGYSWLEKSLGLIKKKITVRKVFFEEEWLSAEQLRELYRKSKIVVALGKNEPFGLVPLEAMSCGVPVIAVDEGGYKETVINEKTGYIIPRNAKHLADKIKQLLSEDDLRVQMGNNARAEIMRKWKWEKRIQIIDKILCEYNDQISNNT